MSVASYVTDDLFRITIIKTHSLNPDDSWANTYEFQADVSGSTDELLSLAAKIVIFEKTFAFNTTQYLRAIIATWQADSVPYDPDNFISSGLTASGELTSGANAVALTQCLHVLRQAPTGRTGHIFFRNCLEESQVQAPAGRSVLNDRPAHQTAINDALGESDLESYIGVGAAGGLHMCLIDAEGGIVRPVLSLAVKGVSQVKTDHKWYNRTGSP